MFRATYVPIIRRTYCSYATLVFSTLYVEPPIQSEKYQCRIATVSSLDNGHIDARNMYRSWNKYSEKQCAPCWLRLKKISLRLSLTLYYPVVNVYTKSIGSENSTFCPHSVFVFFNGSQTAFISPYNIKLWDFITERECVYCAVRTETLYIIKVSLNLHVQWYSALFKMICGFEMKKKPKANPILNEHISGETGIRNKGFRGSDP